MGDQLQTSKEKKKKEKKAVGLVGVWNQDAFSTLNNNNSRICIISGNWKCICMYTRSVKKDTGVAVMRSLLSWL